MAKLHGAAGSRRTGREAAGTSAEQENANQERIQASAPGSKQGLRGAKAGEGAGGEC